MSTNRQIPTDKRSLLRIVRSGLTAALRRIDRSLSRDRSSPQEAFVRNLAEAYGRGFADCPCVFVLSTGRVGTTTLARLFERSPRVTATHEAHPRLVQTSFEAYLAEADLDPSEEWLRVVLAARDDAVCTANRLGRIYLETSHRMTFLAGILARAFPASRFIHLHRHPYPVMRSALCRGHFEHHPWDFARVRPRPNEPLAERWEQLPRFEKTAWHWARINRHPLEFRKTISSDRFLDLPADGVFAGDPDAIRRVFAFAGVPEPEPAAIRRILDSKINAQRSDAFPEVADWTKEQLDTAWRWTGEVASTLGYHPDHW